MSTEPAEPSIWAAFAARHPNHPALTIDPLYALRADLIDALLHHVSDLWTPEEIEFEKDLSRTTEQGGFFHQEPFRCVLLSPTQDGQEQSIASRIRTMLAKEMKAAGKSDLQIDTHFKEEEEARDAARTRQLAYTGWLVTNNQFREERDQLREALDSYVVECGRFPALPHSYFGERPEAAEDDAEAAPPQTTEEGDEAGPSQTADDDDDEAVPPQATEDDAEAVPSQTREEGDEAVPSQTTDDDEAVQAFQLFYRRWSLDRFITWELPLPMQPEFLGHTTHDTFTLSEAGVHLFLPWYMLRDQHFQLHEFAAHLRKLHNPSHLADWLSPSPKDDALGYRRLTTLFVLYRDWKLALSSRYASQLKGKTERVQRAFAAFLDLSEDSVKKLRLELGKFLA